jgi:hypothetical protein
MANLYTAKNIFQHNALCTRMKFEEHKGYQVSGCRLLDFTASFISDSTHIEMINISPNTEFFHLWVCVVPTPPPPSSRLSAQMPTTYIWCDMQMLPNGGTNIRISKGRDRVTWCVRAVRRRTGLRLEDQAKDGYQHFPNSIAWSCSCACRVGSRGVEVRLHSF